MNKTFKVVNIKTGEEIHDAFVLLPSTDCHARVALASYAESTNNPRIQNFIYKKLREIHQTRFGKKHHSKLDRFHKRVQAAVISDIEKNGPMRSALKKYY